MRLPPPWAMLPAALSSSRLLSGRGREQAPAAVFLHQSRGNRASGSKPSSDRREAVLAARLAVAAAAVAAELGEDRHDLVGEVDRQVHVAARRS